MTASLLGKDTLDIVLCCHVECICVLAQLSKSLAVFFVLGVNSPLNQFAPLAGLSRESQQGCPWDTLPMLAVSGFCFLGNELSG